MVSVRGILQLAMTIHGIVAAVYGCAALTHPAVLEPFHKNPSAEHLHWFHMHGLALLAVAMIALYTAAFIEDRVHAYWIGAALWAWTGATAYFSYLDFVKGGNTTQNLVAILAIQLVIYSLAFVLIAALPGMPVTQRSASRSLHRERQEAHNDRHSHKDE